MAELDPVTGLPIKENSGSSLDKALGDIIKRNAKRKEGGAEVFSKIAPQESQATQGQLEEFGEVAYGATQRDLEINRAEKQSGLQQGFNALGRVTANIVPTIIGNAASILDLEDYANQDGEVGNAITDAMDEWKQSVNEALPIHRRNAGKALDISDPGWWWENGASLAESIGAFAATGAGLGGALSWMSGLAKLGQGGARAAQLLTAAGLNQAEAITSAGEVYKETIKHAREEYDKLASNPKAKSNPESARVLAQDREEYAKSVAAQAASHTVNLNRANIALNLTSASAFIRSPQLTRQLVKEVTKKNTLKAVGGEALQEAAEEEINLISEQYGKAKGRGETYSLRNALEDATSIEGAEAAILGAVGGIGQTLATTGIGNLEGGKISDQKKRYEAQQDVIAGIEKISKDANVKSMTNIFDTYLENLETKLEEKELLSKETLTAEDDERLKQIQERKMHLQAYSAFASGTTESLLGEVERLSNMSEEEAINKGIHDGKIKSDSPNYYKNRAREAKQVIEAAEVIYNETKGKYENDRAVYANRVGRDSIVRNIEKTNSLINKRETERAKQAELLKDDPQFNKLEGDVQTKAIDKYLKEQGLDDNINELKEKKKKELTDLKKNQSQYKGLTDKKTQEALKEVREKAEAEARAAKKEETKKILAI